jgi:hypothetical protein
MIGTKTVNSKKAQRNSAILNMAQRIPSPFCAFSAWYRERGGCGVGKLCRRVRLLPRRKINRFVAIAE